MSKGLPTGFTGCTDGGTSIFHRGKGEINRSQVIWLLGNMYLDSNILNSRRADLCKESGEIFFYQPLSQLNHNKNPIQKKRLVHHASKYWTKCSWCSFWHEIAQNPCHAWYKRAQKRCLVEVDLIKTLNKNVQKCGFSNSSTSCALIKRASEPIFTQAISTTWILFHIL